MKAFIALTVVGVPSLLVMISVWKFSCESTLFNVLFVGGVTSVDWAGPPMNLDELLYMTDSVFYGEVIASEDKGYMISGRDGSRIAEEPPTPTVPDTGLPPYPTIWTPLTTTRIEVIESYFGQHEKGDHVEISEFARPRPTRRLRILTCNRNDDHYRIREASRIGDRRLWFISGLPESDDMAVASGPYSRLDIESDQVLITTTRPIPIEAGFAPKGREAFLLELNAAIERVNN